MNTYRTRHGIIEEICRLDENKKYVLDENMSPRLAKTSNIITARDFYKSLGFKIVTSIDDITLLENAIKKELTIITNDKGLCWLAMQYGVEIIFYDRPTKRFYLNGKKENEKR